MQLCVIMCLIGGDTMNKTKKENRNKFRYEIGQTIYKYRKDLGEKQEDIAALLHVTRQMVSKIENGETNLPYDCAVKLANHFRISISELVDGKTPEDIFTVELPVFYQKEENIDYDMVPSYMKKYMIKAATYKDKEGNEHNKTYRIDERVRGTSSSDLYVLELTDENNSLNMPAGAKLIVQKIKADEEFPNITKASYVVIDRNITLTTNGSEYDIWLEKHPVKYEFVTKIVPTDADSKDSKKWFRYSMPNGREWIVELKELKKVCKGIVRKIILDY